MRIALSSVTNMADENNASGGSAARELAALNRRRGDLSTALWAKAAATGAPSESENACRSSRMPGRPATIKGVHRADLWQPGAGKQALAYKRRVE